MNYTRKYWRIYFRFAFLVTYCVFLSLITIYISNNASYNKTIFSAIGWSTPKILIFCTLNELRNHNTDTAFMWALRNRHHYNSSDVVSGRCVVVTSVIYTQRNLSEISLDQTEIRLYLPFSDWFWTKRTSVWCQINRKMANTIWYRLDLIRFRKYFLCVKSISLIDQQSSRLNENTRFKDFPVTVWKKYSYTDSNGKDWFFETDWTMKTNLTRRHWEKEFIAGQKHYVGLITGHVMHNFDEFCPLHVKHFYNLEDVTARIVT